jgi:hypothetical protein
MFVELTRREVDALIAWGCQEDPDSMDALRDAVDALIDPRIKRRWTGVSALGWKAWINEVILSPHVWPLILPMIGSIAVPLMFPDKAPMNFYEIAAQIIPLLAVVLAFDARSFVLRPLVTPQANSARREFVAFYIAQVHGPWLSREGH